MNCRTVILATLLVITAVWPGLAQQADETESLKQQSDQASRRGRHDEAISAARRILELRKQQSGPESPALLSSLVRLAGALQAGRQLEEAERCFRQAVDLSKKHNGPEHPNTGATLLYLAGFYRETAQYARAEPLCEEALRISEKHAGPDNPATISALNSVAMICKLMGNFPKARPLYERALTIAEKSRGPDHPDTMIIVANLAGSAMRLGITCRRISWTGEPCGRTRRRSAPTICRPR